ncbi:MAG: quinolinate synthase NadA [Planctomycetia bacterium]|nr:quinolinate synthase NadA [Planctomycetia bacterium]
MEKFKLMGYKETEMNDELIQHINEIRQKWGKKLLILGHYYVPDEVFQLTDVQGDSLALSQYAESDSSAEAVIFCGVHFMAETADILENSPEKIKSRGGKQVPVMLLDVAAGCPMADMAKIEDVEAAWAVFGQALDVEAEFLPVTYVNSSASVKAFCGRHGGTVCTSANAESVLKWAFSQKNRVFFLPDQNLGRNTALKMGVLPEEICLWNEETWTSPSVLEKIRRSKVILWNGYCPIHHEMEPLKESFLGKIMVHPECPQEVVSQSDISGSTTELIRVVKNSMPGENLMIGTEATLVNRLKREYPDRNILHLGKEHFCQDMLRNTLSQLCNVLDSLETGNPINVVKVPAEIAEDARTALRRMLEVKK